MAEATRGAKSFSAHPNASPLVTINSERQNQTDAYWVATRRAESTGKRHWVVDATGRTLMLLSDQPKHD